MISIIGVGGAGGNIADLWAHMGHSAGAINFSQKDLDSLDHVQNRLRIPGSEGVGKDRNTAIELIQQHYEMAVNFIRDNFIHTDVIALAFSSSGGSGGGISPILLEILSSTFPDKIFIALVVLPDQSEVTMNQVNCITVFEELSRLDIAIFPIDNAQIKLRSSSVGKNQLFDTVNREAVDGFNKLIQYTNMSSKNGNFDKKDFLTTLNTKGIGTISEVIFTSDIDSKDLSSSIQEVWNGSVFTPLELSHVTRAGVIFDGSEEHMRLLQYDRIFSAFKGGMPIDLFEGNYHESKINKVIAILTGLPWITTRLAEIEMIIKNSESKFELINSSSAEYKSSVGDIYGKLRSTTPQKKQSVSDILSKWKR